MVPAGFELQEVQPPSEERALELAVPGRKCQVSALRALFLDRKVPGRLELASQQRVGPLPGLLALEPGQLVLRV